jgi:hypothetical protein
MVAGDAMIEPLTGLGAVWLRGRQAPPAVIRDEHINNVHANEK